MIVVDEAKQVEQQWIKARDNQTGRPIVVAVPSKSEANKYHLVTVSQCDCKGFAYRQTCSHVQAVQAEVARRQRPMADGGSAHLAAKRAAGEWPAKPSEQVQAQAALYHEIFSRED